MKIKTAMLFSNGLTAVFDENGGQMCELQKGWLEIWLEWMESKGVDPSEIGVIEMVRADQSVCVKPIKIEGEWRCKIIKSE